MGLGIAPVPKRLIAIVLALGLFVGGAVAFTVSQSHVSGSYAVRIALPSGQRLRLILPEPKAPSPVVVAAATLPAPAPSTDAVAIPPTPTEAQPRQIAGMIALRYSLTGGARAGDAIEVEKPVTLGGTDAGRIPLRIDGNARVYALGSRLAAIIAAQSGEAAVPAGLDQDFVSLERLRALGIGVRYDAIRDRLVLDPPAA